MDTINIGRRRRPDAVAGGKGYSYPRLTLQTWHSVDSWCRPTASDRRKSPIRRTIQRVSGSNCLDLIRRHRYVQGLIILGLWGHRLGARLSGHGGRFKIPIVSADHVLPLSGAQVGARMQLESSRETVFQTCDFPGRALVSPVCHATREGHERDDANN